MKTTLIILLTICTSSFIFAQSTVNYKYNSEDFDESYILSKNYPDPFNDFTLIEFTLSSDKYVKIFVKDSSGEMVETLVDGEVGQGIHSIHYKPAINQQNGTYYYTMEIYSEDNLKTTFSDKKEMHYDKGKVVLFQK